MVLKAGKVSVQTGEEAVQRTNLFLYVLSTVASAATTLSVEKSDACAPVLLEIFLNHVMNILSLVSNFSPATDSDIPPPARTAHSSSPRGPVPRIVTCSSAFIALTSRWSTICVSPLAGSAQFGATPELPRPTMYSNR